ncbi:hypothetical protein ABPG72_020334 [Tetrahymena utriculariae]
MSQENQKNQLERSVLNKQINEEQENTAKQQKIQFSTKSCFIDKLDQQNTSNEEQLKTCLSDKLQTKKSLSCTDTFTDSIDEKQITAVNDKEILNKQFSVQQIDELIDLFEAQKDYQEKEFNKLDMKVSDYYKGDLNGLRINQESKLIPFYAQRVSFQHLDQIEHNAEDIQELNNLLTISNKNNILNKYQINITKSQFNILKQILKDYKMSQQNKEKTNQIQQTAQKENLTSLEKQFVDKDSDQQIMPDILNQQKFLDQFSVQDLQCSSNNNENAQLENILQNLFQPNKSVDQLNQNQQSQNQLIIQQNQSQIHTSSQIQQPANSLQEKIFTKNLLFQKFNPITQINQAAKHQNQQQLNNLQNNLSQQNNSNQNFTFSNNQKNDLQALNMDYNLIQKLLKYLIQENKLSNNKQ